MSEEKNDLKPQVGDLVHSPYFDDYLEIVQIIDDNNWRFKRCGQVTQAMTPLSHFSRNRVVIVWRPPDE